MNKKSSPKRRLRPDSGEAMVEMALVLPILLVLSLGMIDFGRAFHAKSVLDQAAREGCRVAIVTAPDVGVVRARVATVLGAAGLAAPPADVSAVDPATHMVTVTVTTRFVFVTPGLFAVFGSLNDPGGINMTGQSSMRFEDGK